VLLVGCDDGIIYVFHHKKIKPYEGHHKGSITYLDFDPSGERVVSADAVFNKFIF
jgi:hypothetical protein